MNQLSDFNKQYYSYGTSGGHHDGVNASQYFAQNITSFEKMDTDLQHYLKNLADGEPTIQGFIDSLKGTSFGAKAASVGFKLLSAAANMAVSYLVSLAVDWVIKQISNLIHAQENAQKAFDESATKMKEYNKEISDANKYIDDIKGRYSELAQGVDYVGNNVSLTAAEFSEYNEIANKIADLFPQMIQGYTDEGNAIIKNKGNIEELSKAYNDYVDTKQNAIITDSEKTFEDYGKLMNSSWTRHLGFWGQGVGKLGQISFIEELEKHDFENSWRGMSNEQKNAKVMLEDALGISTMTDNLKDYSTQILAYYNTLKTEVEAAAANLRPIVDAYLSQSTNYKTLTSEEKAAIKNITSTFGQEFFQSFDNDVSKVKTWLESTLIPLFDDEDFSAEYQATLEMQTQFNSNNISYDEYIQKLNALRNLLKSLFPNDENLVKSIDILFNIKSSDGTDMDVVERRARNKVSRNNAGKVGSLTKEQMEALSSSDMPSLKNISDWNSVLQIINYALSQKNKEVSKGTTLTDEAKEKLDAYNDAVSDLAQKEKEFAKNLRDHDKTDHLERLKADISEHKSLLDAYEAQLQVLEWGSNITDSSDYGGNLDIMTEKLALLNQQGAATRAEFERVMNLTPATGDEAVEISNRLSELGEQLRSNVTSIRETTAEVEKLKFAAIQNTGTDYFDKMNYALDSLDKKIDRLKNGKSTEFSSMVPDIIFPTLLDFKDPVVKKRSENKQLLELETTQQEKLNKIISDAVKKQNADNAVARAEERQKLLEDMERTRREAKQKIDKYAAEFKEKTHMTVEEFNAEMARLKVSAPDTTDYEAGLQQMIDDAKDAKKKINGELDTTPGTPSGTPGNKTGFGNPTAKAATVSGKFGEQRTGHTHKGIDLAVAMRTPVFATKDGTVAVVSDPNGYGNAVYIDHGDGFKTIYGHLDSIDVKNGQTVKKGDQIGLSGNTGRSTGPHLHYEVRYNGEAVDPNLYMAYAVGTPAGNAKAKNVGIAGENYRSEILIDKATGKMTHINKPTPIDLSKTDVIGEAKTAEIFGSRAYAEGTDYATLFKDMLDNKKSFDEVFKQISEPFELAIQEAEAWAQQKTRALNSDNTLTTTEKQGQLTEIMNTLLHGNDLFQGYGILAVENMKAAQNFVEEYKKYANENNIAIDSDTLKELQNIITTASDLVDKADDYADKISENIKYALTKSFDDWYDDSENWISQMQNLDIFNESDKIDGVISARTRQAEKIREQLIKISQSDLPQAEKDALWKETYAKYTQVLEDKYKLEKQRYINHLDTLISKEESLRDVRETQYSVINKLAEAEKTAKTALRTSLIGSQYLDPETRKLVYNEDDYKAEISKIKSIRSNILQLSKDYSERLSKLNEDDIEQKEQIINEYKRKVDIQERELEIAQREVDLQKKKDQLNNVLAERNVRQIVNGKWEWVADTDKVREATEAFADAEYELQSAKEQAQQQLDLATYNARIDAINLEKSAAEKGIAEFQAEILKLCDVINYTNEPITKFGNMLKAVVDGSFIEDVVGKHTSIEYDSKGNRILSYDSDFDYKHFMDFFDVDSEEWQKLNEKRNMKIFKDKRSEKMLNEYGQITKIDGVTDSLTETAEKEAAAKSEMLNKEKNATDGVTEALENFTEGTMAAGAGIAALVFSQNTASSSTSSTSKKGGALSRALANDLTALNKWAKSSEGLSYQKSKLDSAINSAFGKSTIKSSLVSSSSIVKKNQYASGTDNAKRGWAELCEKGGEVLITSDGMFRNMSGGEVVFSNLETHNLKALAQGDGQGLFGGFMQRVNIPTASRTETVDKSFTMNGDIVVQNPADFNEFTRKLTQAFRKPRN